MPKKRDLERELIEAGWTKVKRKSGPHDKLVKPGMRSISVPRRVEIDEITARAIRKQAGLVVAPPPRAPLGWIAQTGAHRERKVETVGAVAKREVYICDFELLDHGERVVALPVGVDGATEGYDYTDAIRMSADWLRETALDFLMRGEDWPELPLGAEPASGGRMVTIAVEVGLDEVPSVTAAEAAVMLGVSTARVAQLCKAGLLDSWKVGRTRMVSLESVETRIGEKAGPGRPRKQAAKA